MRCTALWGARPMKFTTWRGGLLGIAALSVAALIVALVAQHGFGMQPCPWCILQRLIYLLIAVVAVVGAVLTAPGARRVAGGLVIVLAGCGIASAVYQHQVASQLFSCNLTFADTVITGLELETLVPPLFQVTASCADAAVSLAGLPFEYWSLSLYLLIAVAAIALMLRRAAAR